MFKLQLGNKNTEYYQEQSFMNLQTTVLNEVYVFLSLFLDMILSSKITNKSVLGVHFHEPRNWFVSSRDKQ